MKEARKLKHKPKIPIPLFGTVDSLAQLTLPPAYQSKVHQADFVRVVDFLKQYQGSIGTFRAYRREMERLLQWTWLIANTSILKLQRQDIERYILFCQRPPISWIGTRTVSRFITNNSGETIPNPKWRLFIARVSKSDFKYGIEAQKSHYQLADKSLREIFTIVGSFYTYLINEQYTSINPVALIRQKSKYFRKEASSKQVMRLSEKQWAYCLKVATTLADKEPEKHERTLFILSILYLLYLRISELTPKPKWQPKMGHFFRDAQEFWWFITVGKGNKERLISVSDTMLEALKRYRTHLGLSPLPNRNDTFPLIPKIRGVGPLAGERDIRKIVQYCFDEAITHLRNRNLTEEADELEYATVHWLRHTGISDDINKNGRPIAHVRDDAGHNSILTTDRYNDVELKERYLSGKDKKL